MNDREFVIYNAYKYEGWHLGIDLTKEEIEHARSRMKDFMRDGADEAMAFGRSLAAVERFVAAAISEEARRNGKEINEERKSKILEDWRLLCKTLPEDEAFRQVTKFLRPCTP